MGRWVVLVDMDLTVEKSFWDCCLRPLPPSIEGRPLSAAEAIWANDDDEFGVFVELLLLLLLFATR